MKKNIDVGILGISALLFLNFNKKNKIKKKDGFDKIWDLTWDELTEDQKTYLKKLGWNQDLWESKDWHNNNILAPTGYLYWDELNEVQKNAVEKLKYNKFLTIKVYLWKSIEDMDPEAIKDLLAIGYTEYLWDNEVYIDIFSKIWKELSREEQTALENLGYTQETWDNE